MKKHTTTGIYDAIRKFFDVGGPPYTYSIGEVAAQISAAQRGWTRRDVGMALTHMARAARPAIQRNGVGHYCRFCDSKRGDVLPIEPEKPTPTLTEEAALQRAAVDPWSKKLDAWAGAHPVVGTEAWTLVNATSEALCREVIWRLAAKRLPEECCAAVVNAFTNEAFPRLVGFDRKEGA
jgi:hypothetical protein